MKTGVLSQVNNALIAGLDGMLLSNGERLTAATKPDSIEKVSDDRLPYLLTDMGMMTFAPWQYWQEFINWDVKATLKIKGEPGEVDDLILDVVFDLVAQMKRLTGLPVDAAGKVVVYGPKTRRLFDLGQLTFLVERGAPYLKSASARPSDGPYCVADLVIHLETTIDVDPRGELPRVQVGVLGVNSPSGGSLADDASVPDPYGIAVVSAADEHAWGAYDTPDPITGSTRTQRVAGSPPGDALRSVSVTPYAVSLTSGAPMQQLLAVAMTANWASMYVTPIATWTSSDPTVATVSVAGLVTWVAPGSITVSCTYGSVASNAIAVTCT